MKVENPHANPTPGASPVDIRAPRPAQKSSGDRGTDHVLLSGDLRLANAAVKAAGTTAEIRQDVVERARTLLSTGQLGNDLERLADRLVEAMIHSHEDNPS